MRLRPAEPQDLAFIRSLTTDPSYTPFIGDDDEDQLSRYRADPATRMMIWETHVPAGFAIFREIGHDSGRVELFRLALSQVGNGKGAAFIAALVCFAFNDLNAKRVWLDASSENPRAMKSYERAGFQLEGRLREHWYRPALGRTVDMMLYGLLRAEWLDRRTPLQPRPPGLTFYQNKEQPMAMEAHDIEALIREAFPQAKITITDLAGDGNHWAAEVVDASFKGMNRVQQQRAVYASLKGKMDGAQGELHALALTTKAPE